jgi:hypothetical protein
MSAHMALGLRDDGGRMGGVGQAEPAAPPVHRGVSGRMSLPRSIILSQKALS